MISITEFDCDWFIGFSKRKIMHFYGVFRSVSETKADKMIRHLEAGASDLPLKVIEPFGNYGARCHITFG